MQMSEPKIADWLAEHPRMMGVLFTMTILLSQAGTVMAQNATGTHGP